MINKPLYKTELTREDLIVMKDYLALRLINSTIFNSVNGYWYISESPVIHFVLNDQSTAIHKKLIEAGLKEVKDKYSDLLKYYNLTFLIDDFNADFIFDFNTNTDLTNLYGLAKITCGG